MLGFVQRRWQSTLSTTVSRFLKAEGVKLDDIHFHSDTNEPLVAHLHRRGLVAQTTHEQLAQAAETQKLGLYCGADPTAQSLHLGNLMPLMVLLHFNLRGHAITALVGGATGAVGDPSGRATERTAMEQSTRLTNVERIQRQLRNFFTNGVHYSQSRNPQYSAPGPQQFFNNIDWWKNVSLIDFLAKFGSMIRVNQMLARDSIKNRLESEQGIGFNEFTYQVLQAYDFFHLNAEHKVNVQVGGNDQYGNIVAGIDLISRVSKTGKKTYPAYGVTVPLLTTASGEKFGKSAGNAVFIDKSLTPGYNLFQFLVNSADADVQSFLYKFSLLPIPVIDSVLARHAEDKTRRVAQRLLAIEVCDLIHGEGEGFSNMVISDLLFNGKAFSAAEIVSAFDRQGLLSRISRHEFKQITVLQLLEKLYTQKSKTELKKLVNSGAVYLGLSKTRAESVTQTLSDSVLLENEVLLVRLGKRDYKVIKVD